MNERAFVNWMQSEPKDEVDARVRKGDYGLLALDNRQKGEEWLPRIPEDQFEQENFGATFQGIGGSWEKYIPLAENYMGEFNKQMLERRREVQLDIYARGPKHRDYIGPRNQ